MPQVPQASLIRLHRILGDELLLEVMVHLSQIAGHRKGSDDGHDG
jgi:hypothetical protein